MTNIPLLVDIVFIITVIITLYLFYISNNKPKKLIVIILSWAILQSILALSDFYLITKTVPPRFALVLIPSVVAIVYGLLPNQLAWLKSARNTQISVLLHSVRLPVEIILHQLFVFKMIPQLMTFEGRNFDIIIGITAPLIYFLIKQRWIYDGFLLSWNIIGLLLVLFILFNGIFSAELPFQLFGFDQPNKAINYFPYILLPSVIVPIVIWTHLSDILLIRAKLRSKN